MGRPYYLSCRLSEAEFELYKRVLAGNLSLDVQTTRGLSRSDLFRLLLGALPRYEGSLYELDAIKLEYASLVARERVAQLIKSL
jgi:hypothetical protein